MQILFNTRKNKKVYKQLYKIKKIKFIQGKINRECQFGDNEMKYHHEMRVLNVIKKFPNSMFFFTISKIFFYIFLYCIIGEHTCKTKIFTVHVKIKIHVKNYQYSYILINNIKKFIFHIEFHHINCLNTPIFCTR